jgi:orotate phosphoribosyltransferase
MTRVPTDWPDDARARLREIIAEKSFRSGRFTLASGKTSDIFINLKTTMLDPEGAGLLGDAIIAVMREAGVRTVGGLAMGAVPLVSAACARSFPDYPVNAFFVRPKVKDHGIIQEIDGNLEEGAKVVLIDDVVTTGGSVMKAVEAARGKSCEIAFVLAIVDRLEGGRENLAAEGLELKAIYDRHDFV